MGVNQYKEEKLMSFCGQCGERIGTVSFCPNCGAKACGSTAVPTVSGDAPGVEPGVVSMYAIAAFSLSMICVLMIVVTLWRMSHVVNFLQFVASMMLLMICGSVVSAFIGGIALSRIKDRNQRGRPLAVIAVGIGSTIAALFTLVLVLAPLIILAVGSLPTGMET